MLFASVEWAGSVVGIISPVLSALVLALVTYLIRTYLPQNIRGQVEQSVSESESEIKKEIQNGITDRLDTIVKHTCPEDKKPDAEAEAQMTGGGPLNDESPFTVKQ